MAAGDHVIPIPGTRRAERLQEWLALPELMVEIDVIASL